MKKNHIAINEEMIAAYLDGELPPASKAEFEKALREHPEWRERLEQQAQLLSMLRPIRVRRPNPRVWDHYWEEIDCRITTRTGQLILLAGLAILIAKLAIVLVLWLEDTALQVAVVLLFAGFITLFGKVLSGRWKEKARDRYGRIRR